ncbi:hypothetical protein [Vreelandella profundi]|uniref:hypothetical protein n=1 Tax=Vreelandella profundi TaxID=2852117 RepID=UPI001F400BF2|nr:hypothetical protein [Halomonas profundi]
MLNNAWAGWGLYNSSSQGTAVIDDNSVYRFEKQTLSGTNRVRIYPYVQPGDKVLFSIDARLLEGDPDSDTCPAMAIDYPTAGDLVAQSKITSRHWKRYEVSFTVPFDSKDEQTLPITAGIWTNKIGVVEFKNPRYQVLNENIGQNYGFVNGGVNYTSRNLLGEVVDSDEGMPVGGIVEQGSNENGAYTKFFNGTLLCEVTTVIPVSDDVENTSGRRVRPYPHEFLHTPHVSFSSLDSFEGSGYLSRRRAFFVMELSATSSFWYMVFDPIKQSLIGAGLLTDTQVKLFAIGRWK